MIRVSIITVAYNAANTIGDTMASIAAQRGVSYEHIVIDGASTDATLAIAHEHSTNHTRIKSEPDRGLYDAMNKGVAMAKGDYIGFLNADDFYVRTDALALVLAAATGDAVAVSGAVVIVRQDDVSRWVRSYSATHFQPWMLRFGHMPPHPGFYVRRDIFAAIGPFDADMKIAADFDWMLGFFGKGLRPVKLPATLVAVRDGGASNGGFASRRIIAREASCALTEHGVMTAPPLLWGKYAAKVGQFFVPPHAFPAPDHVSWAPSPKASSA